MNLMLWKEETHIEEAACVRLKSGNQFHQMVTSRKQTQEEEVVEDWKLTSSASIRFSGRSSCLGLQRQKRTYGKTGREFHKSQRPESGLIWLRSKTLLLLYSRNHTERRAHTTTRRCQGKHKVNHNIGKQLHNSLSLSDFKGRHVDGCDSTCCRHTTTTLSLSGGETGCLSAGHQSICLHFHSQRSLWGLQTWQKKKLW